MGDIDSAPLDRSAVTSPSVILREPLGDREDPGIRIASVASNSKWLAHAGGPAASPQMDPHAQAGAWAQDDGGGGEWLHV